MQVRKGTPPASVERPVAVDITREEIMALIVTHLKSKLGANFRFDDNIQVIADELDKVTTVTVTGVEVIPLNWAERDAAAKTPAKPPVK